MSDDLLPFCECGCGERVTSKGNRFIFNHHRRGAKTSPETSIKLSKARKKYIKENPEYRNKMSITNSGENNPMYGRKHLPKAIKLISSASIQYYSDPVNRDAQSKIRKQFLKEHPEEVNRMSISSHIYWDNQYNCDNKSKEMKNSDVVKANAEKMRGGNDIVNHHYIYDHNNPDQHVVEITRSQHTAHHNWMRRNGIELPHVNVTEENKNIFKGRKLNE